MNQNYASYLLSLISLSCFAGVNICTAANNQIDRGTIHNTSELPVFPGAQGFGTTTRAGRGGSICKVTNLDDSGPGSFRYCAELSEPRNILFTTGGTIEVTKPIEIKHPFVSIYGQTAPGSGILLRSSIDSTGPPIRIMTHDVLLQHMRIRAGGSVHSTCCRDALSIANNTPGEVYNVVVDHNSFSWGTDEIVDIWYDSNNITLSYNIVSEGLHNNHSNESGPAGRGVQIGSENSYAISLHHNFIAHAFQRNPLVMGGGVVDVSNNLIYHWISRGGEQQTQFNGQKVNWVKNNFVSRVKNPHLTLVRQKLNALTGNKIGYLQDTTERLQESWVTWGDLLVTAGNFPTSMYLEDNIGYHRDSMGQPQWKIAFTDWNTPYDPSLEFHKAQRFEAPYVSEIPALDLAKELPDIVGALLPKRDQVDNRIIREFRERRGKMPDCVAEDDLADTKKCENNAGGWPLMERGTPATDSDQDGIPDSWETAHELNPHLADSHSDLDNDGYTALEEWIHSLSELEFYFSNQVEDTH